jgi:hypothetical protein
MGKVAAIAVIAAYKKALGLPMSELKYQGRRIDLSTVTLDDKGNPSFQMPPLERKVWENVDAQDQEVAFIRYSGWDLVQVNRLNQPDNHLTNKEWQYWLDLMGAAPKLLNAAEEALCLLKNRAPHYSETLKVFRLLQEAIEETKENTKNWKE